MSDDRESFEQRDEDARLGKLDERLARAEATEAARTGADRPGADPKARLGNRVLADLIGGVAGGALMGWLFDRLFDTWPVGFLIFLFLGIAVAFRNIFRIASSGQSTPPRGN
jgi:ATP synthase protein I